MYPPLWGRPPVNARSRTISAKINSEPGDKGVIVVEGGGSAGELDIKMVYVQSDSEV